MRIGERFDRWVVLERRENGGKRLNQARYLCRCDCGTERVLYGGMLTADRSHSCGCRQSWATHRQTHTVEYAAWANMKDRCERPTCIGYHNYGGRGIRVCERWLNSFENFYADVGPRPSPKHSLDRWPNPNGHYEPGNVRWATAKEQALNTRKNHLVTYNNTTHSVTEWAMQLGVDRDRLLNRLNAGWSIERAFTEPARPYRRHAATP
jgi:hypothetical protein